MPPTIPASSHSHNEWSSCAMGRLSTAARRGNTIMSKILITMTLVVLISTGCSVAPQESRSAAPTTPIASATAAPAEGTLVAAAKVVPIHQATLSMPSGGIIAEMLVAESTQVQADQVLLRLDQARATAMV